jgi:catabolite regulation protein CreA
MGFRQATIGKDGNLVGGYARVWSVSERNGFVTCNLSTSKKLKDSNNYETDFQDGYVSFYGTAGEKIKSVNIPDKKGVGIQIKGCDVKNKYDSDKKKTYVNYVVYDFDFTDTSMKGTTTAKPATQNGDNFVNVPDGIDEELPFN